LVITRAFNPLRLHVVNAPHRNIILLMAKIQRFVTLALDATKCEALVCVCVYLTSLPVHNYIFFAECKLTEFM